MSEATRMGAPHLLHDHRKGEDVDALVIVLVPKHLGCHVPVCRKTEQSVAGHATGGRP